MLSSEMVEAVRVSGRFDPNDPDYTDARLRQELTETQYAVFGSTIVASDSGSWLKRYDILTTAGRLRYRIPPRALAGANESIGLSGVQAPYEILGDQLVFDTAPSPGQTLRFTYYLRPSLICDEQTKGEITDVDADNLQITVNDIPDNQVTAAPVASGDLIDIVHADGWHELALVNCSQSQAGLVFILPAGTDMSDIEVGDFVRAAGQTDWPCLPDDFHRPLACMTAARIKRRKGLKDIANEIEKEVELDIARFADVLQPRVKNVSQTLVSHYGRIRGSSRRGRYVPIDTA